MSAARRLLLALTLGLATGCAENAILELSLDLPESELPNRYAIVQVDSATDAPSFTSEELAFDRRDLAVAQLSVVAGGAEIERPLWVQVRFCGDASCTQPGDDDALRHLFRYERAFYLGRFTAHRIDLRDAARFSPDMPPETSEVGRCAVFGCRDGDVPAMSCEDIDGELVHFCEL